MAYRMTVPTYDNSAVATRQVLRQRERLVAKGRADAVFSGRVRVTVMSSSKYMPHCGKKQIAKSLARVAHA